MGVGWQMSRTIASAPFQDDETMSAIARGEKVGMWTGKPTGRASWGARAFWGGNSRTRWENREESK